MSDPSPSVTLDEAVGAVVPDTLDLSHRVHAHPEIANMAIAPRGTPGHSREFAEHAGGADGDALLPRAIRVLTATAVELLREPALVDRAWQELREHGGGRRRRQESRG